MSADDLIRRNDAAQIMAKVAAARMRVRDAQTAIAAIPAVAPGVRGNGLLLSNMLKHAFISGRVSMGATAASHSDAWVDYDPTPSAAYTRILAALDTPAPAMGELVEALRDIARQKLTDEMTAPEYVNADLDGGYDGCINRARAALAKTGGA